MRDLRIAPPAATGGAKKQNGKKHYSTPYQGRLPGEWPADFDACGFTDKELRAAESTWREFDELCERVPDLTEQAASIAASEIGRVGFIGTRMLGERVRSWCIQERGTSFRNEIIACIAREVSEENAVLAEFIHLRFCPLDAVPHA